LALNDDALCPGLSYKSASLTLSVSEFSTPRSTLWTWNRAWCNWSTTSLELWVSSRQCFQLCELWLNSVDKRVKGWLRSPALVVIHFSTAYVISTVSLDAENVLAM